MKDKIIYAFLFSAALLIGSSAVAQDGSPTTGFKFGVRVGATVSEFSSSQPHTSEKLGVIGGAVVEYAFSESFSVLTEPSYMQMGGQFVRFTDNTRFGDNGIFAQYATSSKVTASYGDIPLLAKYSLPSIGNFKPNIVAGGSIGLLIGARDTFDRTYHYEQTYFTVHGTENVSSEYEPYQVGATGGIGGEVSLGGTKRLLIDFRYRYGLTPAKKSFSYIDLNAVQGDLYTNSFYFTVGFGF